jgi:hypothetical protein
MTNEATIRKMLMPSCKKTITLLKRGNVMVSELKRRFGDARVNFTVNRSGARTKNTKSIDKSSIDSFSIVFSKETRSMESTGSIWSLKRPTISSPIVNAMAAIINDSFANEVSNSIWLVPAIF